MKKNHSSQQIKSMPEGVKHFLSPAPQHRASVVPCEGQKIKSMPPVTHYVGGGGTKKMSLNPKVVGQKIR
jgi:hypothetical protein